jgi:3-dehydroquinate synthase II
VQKSESSDELRAIELAERGIRNIIVHCPDWKVIPFENLIAQTRNKTTLLADVSTLSDAKIALQALELGVDGVVFSPRTANDMEEMEGILKQLQESILLVKGRILSAKPIGSGARVCIDTCDIMKPGEGMLVGSLSAGLFLIEAEVHRNPHVEPRPFRVNAGPVSSYVLTPGFKTRYLSELKVGDEVLVVNRNGTVRSAHIGRVKIERRPMMLIETEVNGHRFSTIVQNAETVCLITGAESQAVSNLKPGDEVLLRVEEGGRHFGTLVADEMVIEH